MKKHKNVLYRLAKSTGPAKYFENKTFEKKYFIQKLYTQKKLGLLPKKAITQFTFFLLVSNDL